MKTFAEYQAQAIQLPLSLRNNRDRVDLPARGLQEEAGKISSLVAAAFVSGKYSLTQAQSGELKARLADMLWYVALLCGESGIAMRDVAEQSLAQLETRAKNLDPDRR